MARLIKHIDGIRPPKTAHDWHIISWLSQVPWIGINGNMGQILVVDPLNPSQSYIVWDQA